MGVLVKGTGRGGAQGACTVFGDRFIWSKRRKAYLLMTMSIEVPG